MEAEFGCPGFESSCSFPCLDRQFVLSRADWTFALQGRDLESWVTVFIAWQSHVDHCAGDGWNVSVRRKSRHQSRYKREGLSHWEKKPTKQQNNKGKKIKIKRRDH